MKPKLCCMIHKVVQCDYCGAIFCDPCFDKKYPNTNKRPPCQKRPLGEEERQNFTGHWFTFYNGN